MFWKLMQYSKVRNRQLLAIAVLFASESLLAQSPAAQNPAVVGQTPGAPKQLAPGAPPYPRVAVESGESLFQRECAFCHGADAAGGEAGPDLTRSKLVGDDAQGSTIAPVVRSGRQSKGMPPFNLSNDEITTLVAFLHSQKTKVENQVGGRRGVDTADLQTGNAEAGKQYFNGSGTCSSCHSPAGDLAGIASRIVGPQLEQRMLYPANARSKITVKLPNGQTVVGSLAYEDEFTVALRDAAGKYHSWSKENVKYVIEAPVEAHVGLFGKYTDADIHNLMAYLQTLR
jgi:cytochrome c oxidase cbb3-type subunit 3